MTISPTLKRLLELVRAHARPIFLTIPIYLVLSLTELALPRTIQYLLDEGFEDRARAVWLVPSLLFGILSLRGLCLFTATYLVGNTENRVLTELRNKIFNSLLAMPLSHSGKGAEVINLVVQQARLVSTFVTTAFTSTVRDSLTIIALTCYLFWLNWLLALILIVSLPVNAVVLKYINQRLKKLNQTLLSTSNDFVMQLQEAVQGQQEVRIFGAQDYERNRLQKLNQRFRGAAMRIYTATGIASPSIQLLGGLAMIFAIVISLSDLSKASPGSFIAFITAMMMMMAPLRKLTDGINSWQQANTAATAIFAVIDTPPEPAVGRAVGAVSGEIAFERVSFCYPGTEKTVLHEVSFRIKPGQHLALVGASGSGKTTITNLLTRFYQPHSGRITLDGQDIQELDLFDYRRQLATVGQHVVLFNDSLLANITYGSTAVDEVLLKHAIRNAYLDEVVSQWPEGVNTILGVNGMLLSGGQRQRVAIARAFYKDAPLMVLDEATSALDSLSEAYIQEAILKLMKDRTTVIIAHRLSTIEHADQIVVMDDGRVLEVGRHAQLLAQNGAYARIYQQQFVKGSQPPGEPVVGGAVG